MLPGQVAVDPPSSLSCAPGRFPSSYRESGEACLSDRRKGIPQMEAFKAPLACYNPLEGLTQTTGLDLSEIRPTT